MDQLNISSANQQKLRQLESAWREMLAETLTRGFFGTVTVELAIQDGTIQHLRRRIEQLEK